jgi:hypothetical protein
MVVCSIYVGLDEARDSKAAREKAISRLGGGDLVASRRLKVSSVIYNRSWGGWTINFKEVT